uniref:FadR/GntR family transcriptional regulator n=1 Tax=Flavobacterium sp. TaxID=239 RepID=UPI00404B01E1
MKLDIYTKSELDTIQEHVIFNIKQLINLKNLEPGDKLPSERMLSEKFNVSRSIVRDAIQKLEFYGILKSIPQSGTFIAEIGVIAINGMIDDILRLKEPDFRSLVETRILLELKTVRLAAMRRNENDLLLIKNTLDAYTEKVLLGKDAVQEDLLFHLAIAKASNNSTMNAFMLSITPQIIMDFKKYHVCDENQSFLAIKEHESIYNAIKDQDTQLAKLKMKEHFKILYQYCYNIAD